MFVTYCILIGLVTAEYLVVDSSTEFLHGRAANLFTLNGSGKGKRFVTVGNDFVLLLHCASSFFDGVSSHIQHRKIRPRDSRAFLK